MINTEEVKRLDFIDRLNEYINSMSLYARSKIGIVGEGEGISINMMPGGEEIIFMDGERDKSQNMQIVAKGRNHQQCIDTLNKIYRRLENLNNLSSNNDSYSFKSISTTSYPSLILHDESGNFIYEITINTNITIYKGVEL